MFLSFMVCDTVVVDVGSCSFFLNVSSCFHCLNTFWYPCSHTLCYFVQCCVCSSFLLECEYSRNSALNRHCSIIPFPSVFVSKLLKMKFM